MARKSASKEESPTEPPRSLIKVLGKSDEGSVEFHNGDLSRIDHRETEEFMPVDHNTVFGTLGGSPLGLGFEFLPIIQEHFGPTVYLCTIRNWLRKRGISPEGMNWIDLIDLLRDSKSEPPKTTPRNKSIDGFRIDGNDIRWKGRRLPVPAGAGFDLAKNLIKHLGHTVSYKDLGCLGQATEADNTLKKAKCSLTKVFTQHRVPYNIATERGTGYRLETKKSRR